MIDWERENYGDLKALNELGKDKKNSYTVEQLLNPQSKNIDGESNEEVRKRMLEFVNEVVSKNSGGRIAVVSHGAAIKFLLQNWCEYVYEDDSFYFNDEFVCSQKLESPSMFKLVFNGAILNSMQLTVKTR